MGIWFIFTPHDPKLLYVIIKVQSNYVSAYQAGSIRNWIVSAT